MLEFAAVTQHRGEPPGDVEITREINAGLFEHGDGLVSPTNRVQCNTQHVNIAGVVCLQLRSKADVPQCFDSASAAHEEQAVGVMPRSKVGVQPDSVSEVAAGCLSIAHLRLELAKDDHRLRPTGRVKLRLPVLVRGPGKCASILERQQVPNVDVGQRGFDPNAAYRVAQQVTARAGPEFRRVLVQQSERPDAHQGVRVINAVLDYGKLRLARRRRQQGQHRRPGNRRISKIRNAIEE